MTTFVGIDPSTKTGLVMLNDKGEPFYQQEHLLKTGMYATPKEIMEYAAGIVGEIPNKAIICIEGFSFGSKGKGVSTQYGVGFAIRFALVERNMSYFEPTPGQVKKFATGKGNASKENMIIPILRHWNFEHDSDNVRDAYVMARMSMAAKKDTLLVKYQQEVMNKLLEND